MTQTASGPSNPPLPAPRSASTCRVWLLALLLLPANTFWVIQMELFRYSSHPTTVSLFFNAVFSLLVVHGLNIGLRRLWPAAALSRAELLLLYSMICVASSMASHDFLQVLLPYFTYSFYAANPANRWGDLINDRLPTWITVQDPRVYTDFYEGQSTLYRPDFLLGWAVPVLAWTGFILALVLALACLNVLLRRQWLDHEHLACPLVRLPLELTQPRAALWRNGVFWLGLGLAGGMDLWNSVAIHFPDMPKIPIFEYNMGQHIVGRPWSAIGWFPRSLYPFMVGLGYLMPTDFLFSCWFFYLFWKAQLVLTAAVGLDEIRDFPYSNFQCFGAYMLFALSALWVGRGYVAQVWRAVVGHPHRLPESEEPLSYRVAALGLLAGVAGVVWFTCALGMRFSVAVGFFAIYLMLAVAITRMRAQFGAPIHDLHFTGPSQILTAGFGANSFSQKELVTLGVYWWFNRAYRSHPMPHQLEAFKLQDQVAGTSRGVVQALMFAALLGVLSGMWTMLHLNYQLGAAAKGRVGLADGFSRMVTWLTDPQPLQPGPLLAIAVGFGFAFILETLRFRYMGWPFHPLGMAISSNWEMNLVWMPLMIAWLLKTTIVRFGGHRLYQNLLPFFLGLILGQFIVGSVVNLVSIAYHVPSYMFWQ